VLFVGDDWAEDHHEDHHDVELVDDTGRRLARARLGEGVDGIRRLHELTAAHTPQDAEPDQVVVGIQTDRGPWVQALLAAGYQVSARCLRSTRSRSPAPANGSQRQPTAANGSQRHSTSGAKSDAGDAHVLAELVRLDRAAHRPVAGDSELAEAVKLLANCSQAARPRPPEHGLEHGLGPTAAPAAPAAPAGRGAGVLSGVLPRRAGSLRRPGRPRGAGVTGRRAGPGGRGRAVACADPGCADPCPAA
jgi:hypothetical protein